MVVLLARPKGVFDEASQGGVEPGEPGGRCKGLAYSGATGRRRMPVARTDMG